MWASKPVQNLIVYHYNNMQNVSKAGVGMYAVLIMSVLSLFGIQADLETVEGVVVSAISLASFVMWVWGQIDRDDLTFGLWRK